MTRFTDHVSQERFTPAVLLDLVHHVGRNQDAFLAMAARAFLQ